MQALKWIGIFILMTILAVAITAAVVYVASALNSLTFADQIREWGRAILAVFEKPAETVTEEAFLFNAIL